MRNYIIAFKIELVKLFRHSNVLFLFLIVYLNLTPISLSYQIVDSTTISDDFFTNFSAHFAIYSLLIMAIFFVNSIGNDFSEGSFRKLIAMGLSKQSYLIGKILLIILFSLFILFLNVILYYILGILKFEYAFFDLTSSIPYAGIFNQTIALICAGLFGLFFITVFRNRIIGLVFFPFWVSIEFYFKLMEQIKDLYFAKFIPGNALFNLYANPAFEFDSFIIIALIGSFFFIASWSGLKHREETGSRIQ
ncbi:MAG: ABC transporter permease [Bacteroidales bacterium]